MGLGDFLFGSPVEQTQALTPGQLTPEFEELRMALQRQSGELSLQLGEQLLEGGEDGVMDAAREAVGAGVEFAGDQVSRQLRRLQRQTALANLGFGNQLSGMLGARGGLGSSVGSGMAARATSGAQLGQLSALEQGQEQLGRIGVAGAQMLPQVGLQLGQMANRNRALLLANPVTEMLFRRQTAFGQQTGTQSGGPGLLQQAAGGAAAALFPGLPGGMGGGQPAGGAPAGGGGGAQTGMGMGGMQQPLLF